MTEDKVQKMQKISRWFPVMICKKCGHWTNLGRQETDWRCVKCNKIGMIYVNSVRKLKEFNISKLDKGGLI